MADNENPGAGPSSDDLGLGPDIDRNLGDSEGKKKEKTKEAPANEDSPDRILTRTDFSKLKMILDVPLKVSVEIGRTKMLVNDLLQLGQGSVIELDKIAGEPMEILINDKLVAMGEVVVVNEKFGVRLTDVVSQFGISDMDQEQDLDT